jgi:hypothetical protein
MTSQAPATGYAQLFGVLGIQAQHSLSLFTYDPVLLRFVYLDYVANSSWELNLQAADRPTPS